MTLTANVGDLSTGIGARAAFDAVEHYTMANASASFKLTLLEFLLNDARVYAAFADAAHLRWGKRPQ